MNSAGSIDVVNNYLTTSRSDLDRSDAYDFYYKHIRTKRITCLDGFSLSVQASHYHYCSPRSNEGPWSKVEVGFPSAKPRFIMEYAENPDNPTETVYGYVPVELVNKLIESHGGIVNSIG